MRAILEADNFDLGSRQIHRCRKQLEPGHTRRYDCFHDYRRSDQHVVAGQLARIDPRLARSMHCPEDRDRSAVHRQPIAASAVARLIAVVVLPTPPFWFATAIRIIAFSSSPPLSALEFRNRDRCSSVRPERHSASFVLPAPVPIAPFLPFGSTQTVPLLERWWLTASKPSRAATARAVITSNWPFVRSTFEDSTRTRSEIPNLSAQHEETPPVGGGARSRSRDHQPTMRLRCPGGRLPILCQPNCNGRSAQSARAALNR